MALPIIAAGMAARLVAKKIATRAVGGITGKGSKAVNPVYKNVRATTDAIQKNSVKLVKTQAQINAEGIAKGRAAMGLAPKAPAQEIAGRASRQNALLMKSRIKRGR